MAMVIHAFGMILSFRMAMRPYVVFTGFVWCILGFSLENYTYAPVRVAHAKELIALHRVEGLADLSHTHTRGGVLMTQAFLLSFS